MTRKSNRGGLLGKMRTGIGSDLSFGALLNFLMLLGLLLPEIRWKFADADLKSSRPVPLLVGSAFFRGWRARRLSSIH